MYTKIIKPILFSLQPETAHKVTFNLLKIVDTLPGGKYLLKSFTANNSQSISLMGINFPNRVGLAAGLDKNAELLPIWEALGFGFAEIGTLTPKAQPGNPKPRSFRLVKDKALVNRMGFNNIGVEKAVKNIKKSRFNIPLGGNIGKNTLTSNHNAIGDYKTVFNELYDIVDYLVINVSCPNIKDLSKLQDKESLEVIFSTLIKDRETKSTYKPIVLKLSPDLTYSQIDDALDLVKKYGIDGIIATNTTVSRENLNTDKEIITQIGNGGLSGAPLLDKSLKTIEYIRKNMGDNFPIIGSGGVMDSNSAKLMFDAGANLIQLYTGFIYSGITLINQCLQL